jgi:hypothetical protein
LIAPSRSRAAPYGTVRSGGSATGAAQSWDGAAHQTGPALAHPSPEALPELSPREDAPILRPQARRDRRPSQAPFGACAALEQRTGERARSRRLSQQASPHASCTPSSALYVAVYCGQCVVGGEFASPARPGCGVPQPVRGREPGSGGQVTRRRTSLTGSYPGTHVLRHTVSALYSASVSQFWPHSDPQSPKVCMYQRFLYARARARQYVSAWDSLGLRL